MKSNQLFFALALSVLAMAFVACSPASQGEKLGAKYCKSLKGYENFQSPSQFESLKAAANMNIRAEYDEYINKYAMDPIKTEEFLAAFHTAKDTKNPEFNLAYEASIRAFFKKNAWYREKDRSGYYLYSFADDSLNVLNCKEKVSYRLHLDTMFFADEDHTTAIISIRNDSILTLTNANDTSMHGTYRIAEFQDLIRGTWTYRSQKNYAGKWKSSWNNFKENGRYTGEEWQDGWYTKVSGTYKIKQINDSTYRITYDNAKNGLSGKLVMISVDKFRNYYQSGNSEVKTRSKKGKLKDLECLFDKKKKRKK